MNYRQFFAACIEHKQDPMYTARSALVPRVLFRKQPNVRLDVLCQSIAASNSVLRMHPDIFRTSTKLLKRWATRAMRATVPRKQRFTGPALAMFMRQRIAS